jgi:hypothetical protein
MALATYFQQRAAAFSMTADETDQGAVARAGMSLLDAAGIALAMDADDSRLTTLSECGYFEPMPRRRAHFRESPAMRAVVQRPVSGADQTGEQIIEALVAEARSAPRRLG